MDDNLKELLAQKKAHLKEKQKSADIQRYKDHFMKNIEQFSQKYRYADEVETRKIETFLSRLNFVQPGHLAVQEVCPYPHGNVYLCFLMGTDALFEIYHPYLGGYGRIPGRRNYRRRWTVQQGGHPGTHPV